MKYAKSRLIAVTILYFLSGATAVARDDVVFSVEQNSGFGPIRLFVSKNGVHAIYKDYGTELVCKAPTWDAVVFNREKKVFAKRSFTDWTTYKNTKHLPRLKLDSLVGHTQILNHRCSVYKEEPHYELNLATDVIREFRFMSDSHARTAPGAARGTASNASSGQANRLVTSMLYLLDDVKVDYHVAWAIDVAYDYALAGYPPPIADRIPIIRLNCGDDGSKRYAFKTNSISSSTLLVAGIAYPRLDGYRQLATPREVYVAKSAPDIVDVMDQLGVGNDFGKDNSPGHTMASPTAK
jgi:hypothetical protein